MSAVSKRGSAVRIDIQMTNKGEKIVTSTQLDVVRNHLGVPWRASTERMCAVFGLPSTFVLDGPPMYVGVDFYFGPAVVPYPAPYPQLYARGGWIEGSSGARWFGAGGFAAPMGKFLLPEAVLSAAEVRERFGYPTAEQALDNLMATIDTARKSYVRPRRRPSFGWYVPDGDGGRQVSDKEFLATKYNKRIAQDVVRSRGVRWWVSTVFMSIDHNYDYLYNENADRRPVLWETMIFAQHLRPRASMFAEERGAVESERYGDDFVDDGSCWRYHSRSGAKLGHAAVVRALRAGQHVRELALPERW